MTGSRLDTRFSLTMNDPNETPVTPHESPVAARRRELGLSQYSIAKAAGITQTHLRRIETGEVASPSVDLALRLADALRADVRALFPRAA